MDLKRPSRFVASSVIVQHHKALDKADLFFARSQWRHMYAHKAEV